MIGKALQAPPWRGVAISGLSGDEHGPTGTRPAVAGVYVNITESSTKFPEEAQTLFSDLPLFCTTLSEFNLETTVFGTIQQKFMLSK